MRKMHALTLVTGLVAAAWGLARADDAAPAPAPATAPAPVAAAAPAADGPALYDRLCLACHGERGDGHGPGAPWLWPRPRDFTGGELKWRSTDSGRPATDADIALAIRAGVAGTSMHAFGANLDAASVDALVAVVKGFAPEVYAEAALVIPLAPPPPVDDALVALGKTKFSEYGCTQCHGETLVGNGPSAKTLQDTRGLPAPPYDLTRAPLRRPRAPGETAIAAIYKSLVTGLSGTSMPSFNALPPNELWALAAYVDTMRAVDVPAVDRTLVDPIARDLDNQGKLTTTGFWPGHGDLTDAAIWGGAIPLQGEAPAALAPAQAELSSNQCARCHNKQVREWRGSLHAAAASPGLMAQLWRQARSTAWVEGCQRCHNPLAEQLAQIRPAHAGGDPSDRRYKANPRFDEPLQLEGITCAACHVRNWQRNGPPNPGGGSLLSIPDYPARVVSIYERADFCLGCHQLTPRSALAGKPLLNTYREWLEGPYMPRGIQCQHCHMPNREHSFKGVHDPDTFRQGIKLETIAGRGKTGTVSVRARLTNVGAGHYLPTTPTPAAWLTIELVDAGGKPIRGATQDKRIGRHLTSTGGWKEIEDTRIPPGESLELAAAWKNGRVAEATAARITVRVHPDDYYEGLYRSRLKQKLAPRIRETFQQALDRALANRYVALERLVPIE